MEDPNIAIGRGLIADKIVSDTAVRAAFLAVQEDRALDLVSALVAAGELRADQAEQVRLAYAPTGPSLEAHDEDDRPTRPLDRDRIAKAAGELSSSAASFEFSPAPPSSPTGMSALSSSAASFEFSPAPPPSPTPAGPPAVVTPQALAEDAIGTARPDSAGPAPPPPPSPEPQTSQERGPALPEGFEFVKELGRGGMGVVYLARPEGSDQLVVVKTMLGEAEIERRERFIQEARLLANLRHAHIAGVRSLHEVDHKPCYVMDYIVGADLDGRVERSVRESGEPPTLDQLGRWLAPIADALAFCHSEGVIHRDVKPANILIEDNTEQPFLVDFGIARASSEGLGQLRTIGDDLTQTGQTLGTPDYMAPEQLSPERRDAVGTPADVWGLGATLFYARTQRTPFVGETAFAVTKQILRATPPRLRSLKPEEPEWLDELLARTLDRDPKRRPSLKLFAACLREQSGEPLANADLPPLSPVPDPRKLAGMALALLALIAIPLGLWLNRPPRLEIDNFETTTGADEIVITGRSTNVDLARIKVSTDRAQVQLDDAREFRITVPLEGSTTNFGLVPISSFGRQGEPRRWTIARDTRPPTIESFEFTPPSSFTLAVDEPGCRLVIDDKSFEAVETVITATLSEDAAPKVAEVRDGVGNATSILDRLPVRVMAPEDLPGAEITSLFGEESLRKLILRPGTYRLKKVLLSRDLIIEGAGRDQTVIEFQERDGLKFVAGLDSKGPTLVLRDLALRPDPEKTGDKTPEFAFRVERGRVELERCRLAGFKDASVIVESENDKDAGVRVSGTMCVRNDGHLLRANGGHIELEDVQVRPSERKPTVGGPPAILLYGPFHASIRNLHAEKLITALIRVQGKRIRRPDNTYRPKWYKKEVRELVIEDMTLDKFVRSSLELAGPGTQVQVKNLTISEGQEHCILVTHCARLRGEEVKILKPGGQRPGNTAVIVKLAGRFEIDRLTLVDGYGHGLTASAGAKVILRNSTLRNRSGRALIHHRRSPTLILENTSLESQVRAIQVVNSLESKVQVIGRNVTVRFAGPIPFDLGPGTLMKLKGGSLICSEVTKLKKGPGVVRWTDHKTDRSLAPIPAIEPAPR